MISLSFPGSGAPRSLTLSMPTDGLKELVKQNYYHSCNLTDTTEIWLVN